MPLGVFLDAIPEQHKDIHVSNLTNPSNNLENSTHKFWNPLNNFCIPTRVSQRGLNDGLTRPISVSFLICTSGKDSHSQAG